MCVHGQRCTHMSGSICTVSTQDYDCIIIVHMYKLYMYQQASPYQGQVLVPCCEVKGIPISVVKVYIMSCNFHVHLSCDSLDNSPLIYHTYMHTLHQYMQCTVHLIPIIILVISHAAQARSCDSFGHTFQPHLH